MLRSRCFYIKCATCLRFKDNECRFLALHSLCFVAEENSCSSTDAVWMNREQNVQTPVMMHSPHLTSTVLRDPKKMRPEESFAAAYTMPTEQHPHQPVTPQQQTHHHHQAAIDYKYKDFSAPLLGNQYLQMFLSVGIGHCHVKY